jgi:hypothetical protein
MEIIKGMRKWVIARNGRDEAISRYRGIASPPKAARNDR